MAVSYAIFHMNKFSFNRKMKETWRERWEMNDMYVDRLLLAGSDFIRG